MALDITERLRNPEWDDGRLNEETVVPDMIEAADRIEKLRRELTDVKYMLDAYRNMLGERGLEVVAMWDKKRVKRVHFDWSSSAAALSGEERAQHILDIEKALNP